MAEYGTAPAISGTNVVALRDGVEAVHVPYVPARVVRRFLDDTSMITGLFGPLGTAKTTALCFKAWRYAQAFPGAKIAIVRDTWPNLRDTTMATFFTWFPPGLVGDLHKTEKVFTLRTEGRPSQILFRALDDEKDVRNVLSLELAAAALDEPQGGPNTKGGSDPGIAETLYRSLLGRVGRQKGYPLKMLWMVGNPPAPSHWIAKEFGYDPGDSGCDAPTNSRPKRRLYLVPRDENRANLHPTYYEDLEEVWGRDTPLARRFLFGEWIEFATEQPFHRDWIQFWGTDDEPAPDPRDLVIEAGFDPAISKSDRTHRKGQAGAAAYFAQEEGPQLVATARALFPRWAPFILTGLLAGLRWGESAALYATDIDWKRGRLHVQRTWSVKAGRIEAPKDSEGRHVKASPALLTALRAHMEAVKLEGQVKDWTPEQRRLIFPNKAGRVMQYSTFIEDVWQPLLTKAGLPYRKYHATRHTFATWLLEAGTDLRWAQNQLGHASIAQTADTYGHAQPDRHEAAVNGLDQYLAL